MTRVLLSAFDPFGGESINPSEQAVRRLVDGPALDGAQLTSVFLPVVFGEAVEALKRAIAEHEPDVVICVGEAGGRFAVTPERFAINLNDAEMPDNAGRQPLEEPIVEGGPVGYVSTLPVAAMVDAMRAAGIPAQKSSTAGHYVCNNVFYGLMHYIATERPSLRGGFVHVPYMHEQVLGRLDEKPSLSIETITSAVRIAVETSVGALQQPAPARSLSTLG
jgi:pyroglutamyl-peptidase